MTPLQWREHENRFLNSNNILHRKGTLQKWLILVLGQRKIQDEQKTHHVRRERRTQRIMGTCQKGHDGHPEGAFINQE